MTYLIINEDNYTKKHLSSWGENISKIESRSNWKVLNGNYSYKTGFIIKNPQKTSNIRWSNKENSSLLFYCFYHFWFNKLSKIRLVWGSNPGNSNLALLFCKRYVNFSTANIAICHVIIDTRSSFMSMSFFI